MIVVSANFGCATNMTSGKIDIVNNKPASINGPVYYLRTVHPTSQPNKLKLINGKKIKKELMNSWRISQKNIKPKLEKCVTYSSDMNPKAIFCWNNVIKKFSKYKYIFSYDYKNIRKNYFSKDRALIMNDASLMSDFYGEAKRVSYYCATSNVNKCQKKFSDSDLGYIKKEIEK